MEAGAKVVITARGAARLRAGHPWVYRSDVASANGAGPGAAVRVCDPAAHLLGTAFYSSSSDIAIRLLAPRELTESEVRRLLVERLHAAIAYRRRMVSDSDAYRLVFSEADQLPGLIVDRYNDVYCLQTLTQAWEPEERLAAITGGLRELDPGASILLRSDPRVRQLEALPQLQPRLLAGEKSATTVTMNGIRLHYDGLEGQKTGLFLDQRENYAAAARYGHGEALDVFCYHGGFALHLAPVCSRVAGVDSSRPALEAAERNDRLNGWEQIEWIEANAFDLLKDYAATGQQYDTVVLDPPAFAKSRRNLPTALGGYKELNLRALKMLRPGGTLVSCSCSYHVGLPDFLSMLAAAALDAHRFLRIVEVRGQSKDHPVVLTIPETSYLRCVIADVS